MTNNTLYSTLKRITMVILLITLVNTTWAQSSDKDYQFIVNKTPSLQMQYPDRTDIPSTGKHFRALSYDGYYAFVYNEFVCGYLDVPSELRSGFDNSVGNLQKTNTKEYWKRVEGIMAEIDAYWKNIDENKKNIIIENKNNNNEETKVQNNIDDKVFDVVEQMPKFPGGPSAMMSYLSSQQKYPKEAEGNGIQGRVTVQFIVEKDGSITDVKVMKSVESSLDNEAERVVRSMPKWIPGKQNGKSVRVKYFVPVVFRLS